MNLLSEILQKKRQQVAKAKARLSLANIKEYLSQNTIKESPFLNTFKESSAEIKLIAEIKRASPSKGDILDSARNIVDIARIYQSNGATALSILTEQDYFKGSVEDLKAIKETVSIPVLRKDFIIDEYQIYESKYYDSDAILIIVSILDPNELEHFSQIAREFKMDILYEIYSAEDLDKVLKFSPRIIGINNRNLDTLEIDINISARLLPKIPEGILKISESGIKSYQDILFLKSLGVEAFLVGESILSSDDISVKIRELLGYGQD